MSNQRSVGRFCSIAVTNPTGASDSIAALNGSLLGEGAEAFCTSNGKPYRWTSATVTAFSPVFLAATTGGGTWIMQGPEAYFSCSAVGSALYTASGAQASLGLNVWTEFKTGAGFYTTQSGFGGNLVTVNSGTGFILVDSSLGTYRNVPFQVVMTFSVSSSTANSTFEFDLTQAAGGNVGTTNTSQSAVQVTLQGGAGIATEVVHSRLFLPTAGLSYEPVFRCVSSGVPTLYTAYYQVSIVPAGIF